MNDPRDEARQALRRAGSIGGVFSGARGAGAHERLIAATIEIFALALRREVDNRPLLPNREAVRDHLHFRMAHLTEEHIWVLYLNVHGKLIADELVAIGGLDAVVLDTRFVVRRGLELNAAKMIVAHNHPSGCPEPSTSDRRATANLKNAARTVGIELLDHLVIARYGQISLMWPDRELVA